jgi:NAD(P)-dependent dehydrogenase (short-subunit alcohol dehydrogenase family)
MSARFAGRRALVTGASRGIGAAVAERLAAGGAHVALVARTAEPGAHHLAGSLAETAARLARYGTTVAPIVADLSDPASRADLLARAQHALGGTIDILVNNAAAAIYQPLADYPLRRRQLTFEVNVHAPLDLVQQALAGMRAAGDGWVVNVSSATARLADGPPFELHPPGTAMAVYGASKAALNRLSNGLAAELYGTGIRVNTVEPRSAVLTEGAGALVGTVLKPDEIESLEQMAEAVLLLCACPPEFTGRVCVSLDLLEEADVEVRGLDGRALSAEVGP